jgi:hypothetical protein
MYFWERQQIRRNALALSKLDELCQATASLSMERDGTAKRAISTVGERVLREKS